MIREPHFWRWSRPCENPFRRYRRLRTQFGRVYAFILAVGFDGDGT